MLIGHLLEHVFAEELGDLRLDAGDGLSRGAQLAVPLGDVGGEEAAILRLSDDDIIMFLRGRIWFALTYFGCIESLRSEST